jgi:2'-5' RNA ligase
MAIPGPVAASGLKTCALVSYVPHHLGEFLTRLRAELVPRCALQSHLTILPPRVLETPASALSSTLARRLQKFAPFDIALNEVEMFPITSVIYLALGSGRSSVERLHASLSVGRLAFSEAFPFHPHVTLAQDIPLVDVPECFELARRRWAEWKSKRAFSVEHLTFVENVDVDRWETVREFTLKVERLRRTA